MTPAIWNTGAFENIAPWMHKVLLHQHQKEMRGRFVHVVKGKLKRRHFVGPKDMKLGKRGGRMVIHQMKFD